MDEATTLAHLIGGQARAIREKHGARQDDVGTAARRLGLTWQQSTVARLESGERTLSADELLLLPYVLSMATGDSPVRLVDLVPAGATVRVADGIAAFGDELRRLLTGTPVSGPPGGVYAQETFEGVSGIVIGEDGTARRISDEVLRDAGREAEQKAARRLTELLGVDVNPVQVAVVAHRLWGRGLTDERDARVAVEDSRPRQSLRALRGWTTRQLLDELRPVVAQEVER